MSRWASQCGCNKKFGGLKKTPRGSEQEDAVSLYSQAVAGQVLVLAAGSGGGDGSGKGSRHQLLSAYQDDTEREIFFCIWKICISYCSCKSHWLGPWRTKGLKMSTYNKEGAITLHLPATLGCSLSVSWASLVFYNIMLSRFQYLVIHYDPVTLLYNIY